MKIILLLFALFISGISSDYKQYVIDGPSMMPTLHDGDRIIVNTDLSSGIHRDDLIIYEWEGREYCKRVFGIPGDTIKVSEHEIYLNGELKYTTEWNNGDMTTTVLEPDQYYVVGDNINNSLDSRALGPIDESQVVGRVLRKLSLH